MSMLPTILWFRRDLRLADNLALRAAVAAGGPVIPVFLWDEGVDRMGAALRQRLEASLADLGAALEGVGSRLVLRRGAAASTLRALATETGAKSVVFTHDPEPAAVLREAEVARTLGEVGVACTRYAGYLLFRPDAVKTGQGGPYRVYTPYWRAVRVLDVAEPFAAPARVAAPDAWPSGDRLEDWHLSAGMRRGAAVLARHIQAGESAAQQRLDRFITERLAGYGTLRDFPARSATSGLSDSLNLGEISAARCWHAGMAAFDAGNRGAERFLQELVWREFAYHLAHHTPHLLTGNWRPGWDRFPWRTDADSAAVRAWKQGRTGVAFVDAAMREMYVTGRMHNRTRMIAASFLTKHLLTHWRIGLDWFADCLIDHDPVQNAMGWQWVAGSGPDAAPYFRVFNPDGQAEKFDLGGAYRARWIAEGRRNPTPDALSYFDAVPLSWGLRPDAEYPGPVVALADGRARALDAYAELGRERS